MSSQKRAIQHGTKYGYYHRDCRCDACTRAYYAPRLPPTHRPNKREKETVAERVAHLEQELLRMRITVERALDAVTMHYIENRQLKRSLAAKTKQVA